MLVVDLMHEFELGVWKAIFTHLIRILYAASPSGTLVSELNKRYMFVFSTEKYISDWHLQISSCTNFRCGYNSEIC